MASPVPKKWGVRTMFLCWWAVKVTIYIHGVPPLYVKKTFQRNCANLNRSWGSRLTHSPRGDATVNKCHVLINFPLCWISGANQWRHGKHVRSEENEEATYRGHSPARTYTQREENNGGSKIGFHSQVTNFGRLQSFELAVFLVHGLRKFWTRNSRRVCV